jgi:hypothetical protein
LNIFAKNSVKKLAFLTQNKAKLSKILILTLVFEKNANFFADNCQKSQKIMIITSTPDFGWFIAKKFPEKLFASQYRSHAILLNQNIFCGQYAFLIYTHKQYI